MISTLAPAAASILFAFAAGGEEGKRSGGSLVWLPPPAFTNL